jgi:hypothetical protein
VFATYLPKSVKGTRIIAMIEGEEIDNALKKRIRTIQELVIGAFNDNNMDVTHKHSLSKEFITPNERHALQVMHDLMDYAQSDVVPFF